MLLDRKNKIPAEEFKRQAIEIFWQSSVRGSAEAGKMISMKSVDDCRVIDGSMKASSSFAK